MAGFRLYELPIPSLGQQSGQTRANQELSFDGALGEDISSIAQLGSDPNRKQLSWTYRGQSQNVTAEMLARELRELADASGVETVPVYSPGEPADEDGYYSIQQADVERAIPQDDRVWSVDVTLRRKGRRGNHFRATQTTIAQADNPFGNGTTAPVAVHADASKLQWTDDYGNRAPVGSSAEIETRSGEHADVRVFDALEAPYEDPTLLYELGFEAEMRANPVLYDTRGNASKLDDNDVRQWQHVFSTEHDAEGTFVFDSGLLRLTVDVDAADASDQLQAEEWGGSTWSNVSLDSPSGWELFEIDVTRAADDRLEAQLTFSDGSRFEELDMQLPLGGDTVLFSLPDGGPLPDGLETWLSPIAAEYTYDAQIELDVRAKREVRQ